MKDSTFILGTTVVLLAIGWSLEAHYLKQKLGDTQLQAATYELATEIQGYRIQRKQLPTSINREGSPSYGSEEDTYAFASFAKKWTTVDLEDDGDEVLSGAQAIRYSRRVDNTFMLSAFNGPRLVLSKVFN